MGSNQPGRGRTPSRKRLVLKRVLEEIGNTEDGTKGIGVGIGGGVVTAKRRIVTKRGRGDGAPATREGP
jgi:hypothetical protein